MKHYTGKSLRHTGLSKHHTHLKFEMGVFFSGGFPRDGPVVLPPPTTSPWLSNSPSGAAVLHMT